MKDVQERQQLCELVTLTHQLASTFKETLSDFLRVVTPVLFQKIWQSLEEDWDWTGRSWPSHNHTSDVIVMDDVREKEQLQRLYYGLLHAIFANKGGAVMLEIGSEILHPMLSSILQVTHLSPH